MRKPSSLSVKITYFDKLGVRRALKRYVAALTSKHPEIIRIILFGSVARGDAVPGSDVDILIVLSSSEKAFLGRMLDYVPDHFPVGAEVFPYTQAEFEKMLSEGNS